MTFTTNTSLSGNVLSRFLFRTVSENLPRRLKRLMYVSSVLGMVTQNRFPNPELFKPLNRALDLSENSSTMALPVVMHRFVWKACIGDRISIMKGEVPIENIRLNEMEDMDLWKIGLYFARHARPCLQYGSHQLMTADIHDLLAAIQREVCVPLTCVNCETCSPIEAESCTHDLETCHQVRDAVPQMSFWEALRNHGDRSHLV